MMRLLQLRGSLRVRLLAGTLFWITASILATGWGLGSLFHQHVAAQFRAELTSQLDQLTAQLAIDGQGKPGLAQALGDPRLSRPYSGYYWQIDTLEDKNTAAATATGQLRSRSLWDQALSVPADTPADGAMHQHRAGLIGIPIHQLQAAIHVFDQGAAAFHPVTVVAIQDAVDVAHLCAVDMATHHAVVAQ